MWILYCDDHVEFSYAFRSLMEARGHAVALIRPSEIGQSRPVETGLIDVAVVEVDGFDGGELDQLRGWLGGPPIVALTRMQAANRLAQLEGIEGVALKLDGVDEAADVISKVISLSSDRRRHRTVWSAGVRRLILNERNTSV